MSVLVRREQNMGYADGFVDGYKARMKDVEMSWIPVRERQPGEKGRYLVSTDFGEVNTDYWGDDGWVRFRFVIAWMYLPKPYKGDS